MVSLLLAYALLNAACVTVLVLLAHDAPLVDDDPLPATILSLPTNDNDVQGAGTTAATPPRPLRAMHAVA